MNTRIDHLTILSENNYTVARFYEGFFHMRPTGAQSPTADVRIGDGFIELNIKPRLSGYRAQLDHFGLEVDDIALAKARIRESYPGIAWLERPGSRAVPSINTHDPDGNIFDVSQRGTKNRADTDGAAGEARDRLIHHIALRVLHPERVAEFYVKVFELAPLDNPPPGDNLYLSDGRITMVIIPWRISDFQGTGITARGMDHMGFKVESIAALKGEIDAVTERNFRFRPSNTVVGRGKEGSVRLSMFRKCCPLGSYHLADTDGLIIDVTE